jgi:hypothetical protein
MFEIGDVIIHDTMVGIVVEVKETSMVCRCSDMRDHEFQTSTCQHLATYKDLLQQFEGGIHKCVSGQ